MDSRVAVLSILLLFGHRGPGPLVSPAERLNIAEFYFDRELDDTYQREYARLEALCTNLAERRPCREQNLRPVSKPLARVHRAPSAASAVVGELHAVLGFHPDYDLGYSIEFRSADSSGGAVWLKSVGDWGYGIEIPGVRIRGNWIQLFGAPLPADSWIDGRSKSFTADAASIQGRLISLPALPATFPGGARRSIEPGSYLIERIRGSELTLRQEVATDFPCGEDVKPPAVMPPSLRMTARSLFSDTGIPLFSETYGRGC